MNHVFDQTLSRLKEKIARELTKPRHILNNIPEMQRV